MNLHHDFKMVKQVLIDYVNIIVLSEEQWYSHNLSQEVGFFYGMTCWNKFIIIKWQSVEFFFQLHEFALHVIYKPIY